MVSWCLALLNCYHFAPGWWIQNFLRCESNESWKLWTILERRGGMFARNKDFRSWKKKISSDFRGVESEVISKRDKLSTIFQEKLNGIFFLILQDCGVNETNSLSIWTMWYKFTIWSFLDNFKLNFVRLLSSCNLSCCVTIFVRKCSFQITRNRTKLSLKWHNERFTYTTWCLYSNCSSNWPPQSKKIYFFPLYFSGAIT